MCVDPPNTDLYMTLAKLHFKLWFGESLVDHMNHGTYLSELATKRHQKILMKHYKAKYPANKAIINRALGKVVGNTFKSNIILTSKI